MDKLRKRLDYLKFLLHTTFFQFLLFIMLSIVLFAVMYSNVKPEKLNVKLFSVAEQTIRSPITIEDKISTEKNRKEAVDQVKDVYTLKKEYAQNRVDLVASIYDSILEVNDEKVETKTSENNSSNNTIDITGKLEALKEKLTEEVMRDISNSTLSTLLFAQKNDLIIAKDLTITAINNTMSKRIPNDEVENAKKRVEEELKFSSISNELREASIELARYAIVQNEFYDHHATEELRQQAIEGVEPVKILQGQIIVEEGQLIQRDHYRQLELVGLLETDQTVKPFLGLIIIILTMVAGIYFHFHDLNVDKESKYNFMLMYSIVFIISIIMMKVISLFHEVDYSEVSYFYPAAMGAMMIKILMNERLAIMTTITMAIVGMIVFNEGVAGSLNVTAGVYILFSGIAGLILLSNQNHRAKILRSGLFVVLINLLIIIGLLLIKSGQFSGLEFGVYILGAFVSGITSAVLTIGFLPFFEAGFGILSTMKLIELSNPNHPLLRKILTEAPGTYHHSVMVANLAESACEAIGANGLLARVGCYYHDIGKTKRPQFFIENQMNIENPHDRLAPQTSRDIIIAHATDGSELLKKHKLPKEIVDIAEQHHGTSLLKFFYHKALKMDENTKEDDYRYPGPKAQTKETAIISIADSVEAAVRSMNHPTPEQIETLVHSIIVDKLQDGQLNACNLTLRELEMVEYTLCETLNGIFHSRIEYPELTKQKGKEI